MTKISCAFVGCLKTTENPARDWWLSINRWGPGASKCVYCADHGLALIALRERCVIAEEQARRGNRARRGGGTALAGPRSGQPRAPETTVPMGGTRCHKRKETGAMLDPPPALPEVRWRNA